MARKKETAIHKRLSLELISLIPKLDDEGLSFLIEQARIHLYNTELDIVEQKSILKASKDTFTKDSLTADFRIERSSSGSSYHLISGGKWKMFNEDEMLRIVQIAQSKDSLLEVTERLHRWLMTERPDTFADLELGDQTDPKMQELVEFLRKKFSVKKR